MRKRNRGQNPKIVVKSTGGAAAQVLTLLTAIYVSHNTSRHFLIRHYPFGTGGFYPLAISNLLREDELQNEYQLTKGFIDDVEFKVGSIAENHPIFRAGINREKIAELLRRVKLDTLVLLARGEWALGYSSRKLNKVPSRVKIISGGYFPFRDKSSVQELAKRFMWAGLPDIFNEDPNLGFDVGVVIHYRLGNKRTAYSHPELGGAANGIIDPDIFKNILESQDYQGNIYLVSDEPDLAKELLLEVGIRTLPNPLGADLWLDLKLMANAKILICPWSTVSQLAISCIQNEKVQIFYPDQTGDGAKAKWVVSNVSFYKPRYLEASHRIFQDNFIADDVNHKVYKQNVKFEDETGKLS